MPAFQYKASFPPTASAASLTRLIPLAVGDDMGSEMYFPRSLDGAVRCCRVLNGRD